VKGGPLLILGCTEVYVLKAEHNPHVVSITTHTTRIT
jgi:hypothetical protein